MITYPMPHYLIKESIALGRKLCISFINCTKMSMKILSNHSKIKTNNTFPEILHSHNSCDIYLLLRKELLVGKFG